MVAVNDLLGGHALFLGADGDGHSVLVTASNEHHVHLLETLVTDINIGRNVCACQMAYVQRAVGVGQGRCNQNPLVVFHI